MKKILAYALIAWWILAPTAFAQIKGSPEPRGAHSAHGPHMAPAATPAGTPSPSPSPTSTPLTPAAIKLLGKEFARAQENELKAMDHQNKSAVRELKASQSARQKEWQHREQEARHKFFAEHPKGAERRDYVHDFVERRKVFLQMLADEASQRAHEQEVRYQSLKEDQAARLKEFQEAIKKGEKPQEKLWPAGH